MEWYSVPDLSRVFWLALFIHSFVNCLYNIHCLVAQSCPTLVTPWAVAHQAPLSMGFPRREYWSRLLFPSSLEINR